MARHPDLDSKINVLLEFWTDPCDAPFTIYARALYPAVLKAFVSYYALDLLQIFVGFAKPHQALKMKRSGPHGKGKQKRGGKRTWSRRWRKWLSFDPYDSLGRVLGAPFDHAGRQISPGVATLWNIYDLEQRIVYKIMVLGIVFDFFYDWAAGVMNSTYCQTQYMSIGMGRQPAQGAQGILDFWPIGWGEVLKERNGAIISGPGGRTPYPFQTAVYTGEVVIANPTEGPVQAVLKHQNGQEIASQQISYPGGVFALQLNIAEVGSYSCGSRGQGFWLMKDCEFTVWAFPPEIPPSGEPEFF